MLKTAVEQIEKTGLAREDFGSDYILRYNNIDCQNILVFNLHFEYVKFNKLNHQYETLFCYSFVSCFKFFLNGVKAKV